MKKNIFKKILLIAFICLFFTGCETIENIGQDIEKCENLKGELATHLNNLELIEFDTKYKENCTDSNCSCLDSLKFQYDKIKKSDDFVKEGKISSAYDNIYLYLTDKYKDTLGFEDNSYIINYFKNEKMFKLIVGDGTNSNYSWHWDWQKEYKNFKFKSKNIKFGYLLLSILFNEYDDTMLIDSYILDNNKLGDSDFYKYKVLDNIIYIEYKNEYKKVFEIVKLEDNEMYLKLLLPNKYTAAGQVYRMHYSYDYDY